MRDFYIITPDVPIDIVEAWQQLQNGNPWLVVSLVAILYTIVYVAVYDKSQNFHFLLVRGDELIKCLALYW